LEGSLRIATAISVEALSDLTQRVVERCSLLPRWGALELMLIVHFVTQSGKKFHQGG
jgi:hypothetical protein